MSCVLGTRPERNADAVQNTTGGTVIAQLELPGQTGADLDQAIARYPTLDGCRALRHDPAGDAPAGPDESVGRVVTVDGRLVVTIAREAPRHTTLADYWKLQDDLYSVVEIDRTYPLWPHPHLVGYVQPSIAGNLAPSPLMLWWGLLLGLSSLARYHPAAWVRAIDLDESQLAAPLREVLDAAVEQVPVRVLEALRLDR